MYSRIYIFQHKYVSDYVFVGICMFQTTYLLECVYSKKCIILESKTRFATKISSNWDIVHLSPNCWQYISNTNYCHQRTSLNNKLLFTLSKADRVAYKALYSISLENHTIQQLAGNNQYDICDFKVPTFQGPNLPHQHFSGAQFAGARFAGAQFARAQYAGAQFTGDQYAKAQFARAQFARAQYAGAQFTAKNC